jgi:putative aldouronate transport system permease protein
MAELTTQTKKTETKFQKAKRTFIKEKEVWLICIPMIIWVLIFCYYPMYGNLMAFVRYIPGKSIFECKFVGLKYFRQFFESPDFKMVLRNTLSISGLGILFGFPAPIILALLINEIKNKHFKKTVQTISYLPHFVSWVVTASLLFSFLSTDGLLNEILLKMGKIDNPISFLGEGKYFWTILTSANIWKEVGWSSIIYLSAIAGIDSELYDAGAVDGLGRFGMVWHITLPGIRNTIGLLFVLGLGGILNAGFEQQLLLGAPQTREYWDVIDTYSYRYGIQMGNYSYAAAVGIFKSVISFALVLLVNKAVKKFFDVTVI